MLANRVFNNEDQFSEADIRDQLELPTFGQQVKPCDYLSDIIILNNEQIPKNAVRKKQEFIDTTRSFYLLSIENTIEVNEITNSKCGVRSYSWGNEIFNNNIYSNEKNVDETAMLWYIFRGFNEWDGNYWGEPLQQAVRIPVKCYFGFFIGYLGLIFGDEPLSIRLYLYDKNPASEPYVIGI